jgi:ribonuclease HI
MNNYTIYTDGGSRGNPGPAGAGGVIYNSENKIVHELSEYLGINTNNYAEYKGIILTLKKAIELNINTSEINVFMDSKLVVNQINGQWKVKHPNIIPLHKELSELLKSFEKITFKHIYRNLNTKADSLANMAMDSVIN